MQFLTILLGTMALLASAADIPGNIDASSATADETDTRGPVLREEYDPVTGSLTNVCHLRVRRVRFFLFPSEFNSTAVLFEKQYLITAAHNVHSTTFSRITKIGAACGRANSSSAHHTRIDNSQISVAAGYKWRDWQHDYAVLKLPYEIASLRPMILRPLTERDLRSRAVVAGFPGTDDPSAPERIDGEHLFSAQPVPQIEAHSFFVRYDVKTYTGNSGGPVWLELDEGPVLLGIHISGDNGEGVARQIDTEAATLRAMIVSLAH